MEGNSCPQCSKSSDWLGTTNEWEFYCPVCDVRFDRNNEIVTRKNSWRPPLRAYDDFADMSASLPIAGRIIFTEGRDTKGNRMLLRDGNVTTAEEMRTLLRAMLSNPLDDEVIE